jgi:hypothetical protein
MRLIQLDPYIQLGISVRSLLDAREGEQIRAHVKPGGTHVEPGVLDQITLIDKLLEQMGLNVTRQAFLAEMKVLRIKFDSTSQDAVLTERNVVWLKERMKIVSDVLRYEAASLNAYLIADKRLRVDYLLGEIGRLFGENVFLVLPDIARYDFAQAGKCIAFEVPTAAAFHILRGTEAVLRAYYSLLVPGSSSHMPVWGTIIAELRKITHDPPPKELLDNLDNIRANFRNPTQHPEKIYDLDETQDLFNLCVDVINRMAKDLFQRNLWDPCPF